MTHLVWNASHQTVADLLGEHARNACRILTAVAFLSKDGWKIEILDYLRNLCGFDSMGHTDHFLSYVYSKYVKPALEKS